MTFTGRLRDQRGGYLWLRTATGTDIALLRSDGNPEIPVGYTLDTAASEMLDDGLSGDSSTFVIPRPSPSANICSARRRGSPHSATMAP